MTYDAMSRGLRITNPVGSIYRLQYNAQGFAVAETDEDGRVLGVLVVIACYVVLIRRPQQREFASMSSQVEPEVGALSLEQARVMVDDLIAKGEKLFAAPADETRSLPDGLGPITREFFSRYGTLKTRRGGFELSASGIRASDYVHEFLSIGHSEDWDVVQRMGDDEVFVVEGAETRAVEMETRFPSVYHLAVNEALQA